MALSYVKWPEIILADSKIDRISFESEFLKNQYNLKIMPTNIMPTSKFIYSWSALENKVLVGSEFFRFR